MSGLLEGKVAVVTGAGSGIGRATALAMAREGAAVVVADIDAARAGQVAATIDDAGGRAVPVAADVTRDGDVTAMVAAAVEHFGRLDCAVNNAGIPGGRALTAEQTEAAWDQVLAVNVKGVWRCLAAELRQMLAQDGGGSVVNMSSALGFVGTPMMAPYTASKGAVIQLTRSAALEYAAQGIRINAVCPGPIATRLLTDFVGGEDALAGLTAMSPIGRLGEPEEIAEACVWLCSERASLVTGSAMLVDGGFTAQ